MPSPINRARALRRNATDAETKLWSRLRNRQLNGMKFRRQAPLGPYFADFLCRETRLIIEIDGGQHDPERDQDRTTFLNAQGYHVIRFWNHDVLANIEGVLTCITEHNSRGPHPNPLPEGEGETKAPPPVWERGSDKDFPD
ncbi:endonuclease domain-containing protein [Rhodospirillaceae bacterium KN72]|uniref:Endonuclease domain-containing protein n=1 Tax=Pacificispira spongiicola TaxID=2729598 RepID=A0A7Y0HHJ4_9PROT|nr:endonuclease domain-containing protein [Pacificispira spongiicola]NMM45549.1 endonuclease domain-containing protein [Pacificispira spongiicola]